MNQRLVWNFEFLPKVNFTLPGLLDETKDPVKWESRYFWQNDEIIVLRLIDESLLNIANYQQKYREDNYYLLPKDNYNIKRRHNQLLYKPLIKITPNAMGYGSKITLDPSELSKPSTIDSIDIIKKIEKESTQISVKKVAFIYKLPTNPPTKIEFARLETCHKIYFSLCIEGRSLYFVETIAQQLINNRPTCDYVTFLKKILNYD